MSAFTARIFLIFFMSFEHILEIETLSVSCTYQEDPDYACLLRDIHFSTDEHFEINGGGHSSLKSDDDVQIVRSQNSNFHTVPLAIFKKFKKLEEIMFDEAQMKTLSNFEDCANLKYVYLRRNQLKSLPSVLNACLNVEVVRVTDNEIATVDANLFNNHPKIRILDLSTNRISELDQNLLSKCSSLAILYINHNNLESISPKFFQTPQVGSVPWQMKRNLRKIWMNSNPLKNPETVLENLVKDVPNLEEINAENIGINQLSAIGFIRKWKLLKFLYLGYNEIADVPENMFIGMDSMEFLGLHVNLIVTIHSGAFQGLGKLQTLRLHSNKIVSLQSEVFHGVPSLFKLDLYGNPIKELPPGVFAGLNQLKYLFMDRCDYSILRLDTFGTLPELLELNFGSPKLEAFSSLFFDNFPKLRKIYAPGSPCADFITYNFNRNTDLKQFEKCFSKVLSCVYGQKSCEITNMYVENIDDAEYIDGYNRIDNVETFTAINSKLKVIPSIIFQELNLKTINLYAVEMPSLQKFENCTNLGSLELPKNQIKEVGELAFNGLFNLKTLGLHMNEITSIHSEAFSNIGQLEVLRLQSNRISSLSSDFFRELPNLWLLEVFENPIREFPLGLFTKLQKLSYLTIDKCNYSILRMDTFGELPELTTLNFGSDRLEALSSIFFSNFPKLKKIHAPNASCANFKTINFDHLLDLKNFDKCFSKVLPCVYGDKSCEITNAVVKSVDDMKYIDGKGFVKNIVTVTARNSTMKTIPEIVFREFQLRKLELNGVGLSKLPKFENCSSLLKLSLQNNEIEDIEPAVFENCKRIGEINLKGNKVSNISRNCFSTLGSVTILSLSNNSIEFIPNDAFMYLSEITYLDLSENELSSLGYLKDLNNLLELKLDNNKLHKIYENLELSKLVKLSLSHNIIEFIRPNFFKNLKSLKYLELSENFCINATFDNFDTENIELLRICFKNFIQENICEFHVNTNHGYSCQLKLDMDLSDLTESSHLEGKTNDDVEYLHSKNHPISFRLSYIFEKFKNIQRLELWRSSIVKLESPVYCSQIKTFDLRLNQITEIQTSTFSQCYQIEKLILIKNEIRYISGDAFIALQKLSFLDLSLNKISTLADKILESVKSLTMLNLSGNNLKSLSWIIKLDNLKVLKLNNNRLEILDLELFANLEFLEELHLENNLIATTSSELHLRSLKYLNLANNSLTQISFIKGLSNLKYLDVSKNNVNLEVCKSDNFCHLETFYI